MNELVSDNRRWYPAPGLTKVTGEKTYNCRQEIDTQQLQEEADDKRQTR